MKKTDIGDIFKKKFTLPALPNLVLEIQSVIKEKNIEIDRIAVIIKKDPAMTAEVFKIVNSAYYSIPKTDDLKYAVHFLGFQGIYPIVLSISAVSALKINDKEYLKKFWKHSFETAQCVKKLVSIVNPDTHLKNLWCPAIMHDIGKLIYFKFYPEQYKVLLKHSIDKGVLFSEVEKNEGAEYSTGFLGALLCDEWKLPESIKIACKSHCLSDTTVEDEHTKLKQIICAGSIFSEMYTREINPDMSGIIKDSLKKALSLTDAEYIELFEELRQVMDQVEAM